MALLLLSADARTKPTLRDPSGMPKNYPLTAATTTTTTAAATVYRSLPDGFHTAHAHTHNNILYTVSAHAHAIYKSTNNNNNNHIVRKKLRAPSRFAQCSKPCSTPPNPVQHSKFLILRSRCFCTVYIILLANEGPAVLYMIFVYDWQVACEHNVLSVSTIYFSRFQHTHAR